MPEQGEQLCNARLYAATGAGLVLEPGQRSGADIVAAVTSAYKNIKMRQFAETMARETNAAFAVSFGEAVLNVVKM